MVGSRNKICDKELTKKTFEQDRDVNQKSYSNSLKWSLKSHICSLCKVLPEIKNYSISFRKRLWQTICFDTAFPNWISKYSKMFYSSKPIGKKEYNNLFHQLFYHHNSKLQQQQGCQYQNETHEGISHPLFSNHATENINCFHGDMLLQQQ